MKRETVILRGCIEMRAPRGLLEDAGRVAAEKLRRCLAALEGEPMQNSSDIAHRLSRLYRLDEFLGYFIT